MRWNPFFALVLLAAASTLPRAAAAAPVRVLASDAKGVTLQLTVGAWSLSAPDRDGRVEVTGLRDAHALAEPGRPMLPAWSTTLALPPGSEPTVRVLESVGEQARDGVRPVLAARPVFRPDPTGRLGEVPGREPVAPIEDGVWPPSMVSLDRPFGFRGRRLVQLELRPFRHDPATGRIASPLVLTVRVDFNRQGLAATAATTSEPDRHADAVLDGTVLNWSQAQGWRVPPAALRDRAGVFGARPAAGTSAQAFDESQPEVRVQLGESALYRLDYESLAAQGYPAAVPVAQVSVHRHEAIEGAVPPYVTIELPCEIEDADGNGVFGAGDAVWVYARDWASRTNASRSRRWWGDAEVVYVTRVTAGGARPPQRAGWNGVAGLTSIPTFPFTKHFERDAAPIMQFVSSVADTNLGLWQWTDVSSYYSRPDTIRVDTQDLDDTQNASISVRWVGRKFDTHLMWAALRNGRNQVTTVIDSVAWFGKTAVVRTATFPGTALTEGNTNFFRQWGKNQFAAPDPVTNTVCFAGLDAFDLTYARFTRASFDYLRFNSGTASGPFQMTIDGFSTDSLRLYDVTDPERPVRLTIAPAQVRATPNGFAFDFQDVANGRREYVAACLANPPDPAYGARSLPATAYSRVTRRDLWANVSGDYLLVYPQAWAAAAAKLAAFRRTQGLSVVEAPAEAVYDEFGDGRHAGVAIERFARYGYARWNTRFLLLMGDGTLDPNGTRRNSGKDWIPALPTPGPVGASEGLEITVSDNRYGNVTGNQDPISSPDSNRVVPEIMVGRLTVNSLAEANTVVDKLVAYENLSGNNDWRRNVLMSTDDAFSGETTFGGGGSTAGYCHRSYEELFLGLNQTMTGFIASDSGLAGLNVEPFTLRSYLQIDNISFDPINGDTCRVSRDEARQKCHASVTPLLLGKLNAGQLLWNYQGHANEYVLTHEDLWINSGNGPGDDAQRLVNDGKPFFFSAFSCHPNMFARPEVQLNAAVGPSLGEDLLALPNGRGAIASWASTCYEVVPRNDRDHLNVELIRSLFVNPPRDETLGADDRGSRVVLGEVILSALFRYLGTTQTYQPERGLSITYTLLGDPATRLSIGRPLDRVLANGQAFTSGEPIRLHTAGDTLRLDADFVSNVRLDSLAVSVTDAVGEVLLPASAYTVTPAFPDTAGGGVYGGRRFHVSHTTVPGARSTDIALVARDRNGLVQRTVARLQFDAFLRSSGVPVNDGDEVPPQAQMSFQLLCPRPIADPSAEIQVQLNGRTVPFSAVPAPGDTTATGAHSRREWIVSWSEGDYAIDDYTVTIGVTGGSVVTRRFRVTAASGRLAFRDLVPFPNPFDATGTWFSFTLLGGEPADLKLRIMTLSGRTILTRVERGVTPGYHQWAWDGRDAEGDDLANGVYFYRLSATTPSGLTASQFGKLVKLRKPRRIEEPVVP